MNNSSTLEVGRSSMTILLLLYLQTAIEDSLKKSTIIRKLSSVHTKALKLERRVSELVQEKEKDEKTIQALNTRLTALATDKDTLRANLNKSRELFNG